MPDVKVMSNRWVSFFKPFINLCVSVRYKGVHSKFLFIQKLQYPLQPFPLHVIASLDLRALDKKSTSEYVDKLNVFNSNNRYVIMLHTWTNLKSRILLHDISKIEYVPYLALCPGLSALPSPASTKC